MNEKKRKAYIAEMISCGITLILTGINLLLYRSLWLGIAFGAQLAAFIILSVCFVLESRKK